VYGFFRPIESLTAARMKLWNNLTLIAVAVGAWSLAATAAAEEAKPPKPAATPSEAAKPADPAKTSDPAKPVPTTPTPAKSPAAPTGGQATSATQAPAPAKAPTAPTGGQATSATLIPPARIALAATVHYAADIAPILDRYGCNAVQCHGAATGKGGLRLSLFGAYPDEDYSAITREAAGRRINRVEPARSLLLVKATGGEGHTGGKRIEPGSPEAARLTAWIAEGASWRDDKAPRLVSIKIVPETLTLRKGETGSAIVKAAWSDGHEKDVTADARYQASEPGVAEVVAGKVTARECGKTAVVVSYLRRAAVLKVAVPQALPGAFPAVAGATKIDELVLARLKELGIPPSGPCTDEEFVRRVHLDVIGLLPTPEEARAFAADKDGGKRAKLIDRLLARDEFADYWALKWGDLLRIKSEYPINLWPNAVQAYYRWVREGIVRNKPYNQFATELLTATGSNFTDPPANYARAIPKRDAQTLAEATALVFMGARIGCARCHAHPTEDWTLDDDLGLAAFFAKVQYKNTQQWKEEVVWLNPDATVKHPRTRQTILPKLLGGPVVEVGRDEDPRRKFAAWLTAPDNPWFARNIVNRIWFWLLGRGIVHEPDDMRPTNPPTNPELLAYLEHELVGHGYDLKHVYRLSLNSQTYQRSSKTDPLNVADVAHFSHYPVRRIEAEALLDAIGQVTETAEEFTSRIPEPYTKMPKGFRAEQLPDGSIGTPFLELFGRPPRDTPYEEDRCDLSTMRQALHMVNSSHLEGKVTGSARLQRLLKSEKSDAEIIEELYLAALSRPPTDAERTKVLEYVGKDKKARAQAVQDVLWAVLNTKEFLCNH
jgi:hypothetical protein